MKRLFALLALAAALWGCHDDTSAFRGARRFGFEDFALRRTFTAAEAETVLAPQTLFNPQRILLLDSLIATYDLRTDCLLHLFSPATGRCKGAFLKEGHGPGELAFSLCHWDRRPDRLVLYDARQALVFDRSALGDGARPEAVRPLPDRFSKLLDERNSICYDHSGDTSSAPARLAIRRDDETTVARFGDYPEFPHGEIPASRLRALYLEQGVVNRAGDRIALLGEQNDLLEIWDIPRRRRTALLHGPNGYLPELVETRMGPALLVTFGRNNTYFNSLEAAGDLWTGYDGNPMMGTPDGSEPLPASVLRIGWDGTLKACYTLPWPIRAFDIDDTGTCLYCLTEREGEPSVVRFELHP